MTPDILQAASLYVDVAHAQEMGTSLFATVKPRGYRIEISSDPSINLERAVGVIRAQQERMAWEKR